MPLVFFLSLLIVKYCVCRVHVLPLPLLNVKKQTRAKENNRNPLSGNSWLYHSCPSFLCPIMGIRPHQRLCTSEYIWQAGIVVPNTYCIKLHASTDSLHIALNTSPDLIYSVLLVVLLLLKLFIILAVTMVFWWLMAVFQMWDVFCFLYPVSFKKILVEWNWRMILFLLQFLRERNSEYTTTLVRNRVLPLYSSCPFVPYLVATANWIIGELASCLPQVRIL